MPDDEKIVTLAFPIKGAQGEVVTEVHIRRPQGKDMRALETSEGVGKYALTALMISLLTGLTVDQVDEFDTSDFEAVGEAVADFFDPKGATTET